MIFASVSAHGATGTWLDEILELGVPLLLFVGLWWWSTRKKEEGQPTPEAGQEDRRHLRRAWSRCDRSCRRSRPLRALRLLRGARRRVAAVRAERRATRHPGRGLPRDRLHHRAEHPDSRGAVHRAIRAEPDAGQPRHGCVRARSLSAKLRHLPRPQRLRRRSGGADAEPSSVQPSGARAAARARRALLLDTRASRSRDARVEDNGTTPRLGYRRYLRRSRRTTPRHRVRSFSCPSGQSPSGRCARHERFATSGKRHLALDCHQLLLRRHVRLHGRRAHQRRRLGFAEAALGRGTSASARALDSVPASAGRSRQWQRTL